MGSVQSTIECPHCKKEECIEDDYYKSGEVYIMCPDCGYYRSHTWKRGEDGKFVRKDEAKGYEYDNLIAVDVLIDKPYGAYRIDGVDGAGQAGGFATEDEYQKFVSEIVSLTNQPNEIESVVVSRYVDGKIVKESIYKK